MDSIMLNTISALNQKSTFLDTSPQMGYWYQIMEIEVNKVKKPQLPFNIFHLEDWADKERATEC